MTRIYWCTDCNVPLLGGRCGLCGGRGRPVKLTGLADPRPASPGDLRRLREASESEFGLPAGKLGLDGQLIVLNRIPYMDEAEEVVVAGSTVGHLFFDLYSLKWRFKPFKWLCQKLLEDDVIPEVRVSGKIYSKSLLDSPGLPGGVEDGCYVALTSKSGLTVGLGEATGGKVWVLKTWSEGDSVEPSLKPASYRRMVEANLHCIREYRSRSCRFLVKLLERFKDRRLTLSYSGGKDSLAVLGLALDVEASPILVFCDTGLELPETQDNAAIVAEKFGLDLTVASAGRRFWDALPVYGPPARGYRWCCKICKLTPTAKAYRESIRSYALSLVGQRKFESRSRRSSPRLWRNPWIPGVLAATPIHDWTMLHVWLYLEASKLIDYVNPLYPEGFDRIGCYLCPYCNVAEFREVESLHPELWTRWLRYIEDWSSNLGYPEAYIERHCWRWVTLPSKIAVFLGLKEEIRRDLKDSLKVEVLRGCRFEGLTVALPRPVKPKTLETLCYIEGLECRRLGDGRVTLITYGESKGYVFQGKATVAGRAAGRILKTLVRSVFCVECGSCVNLCPQKALKLCSEGLEVDVNLCSKCRVCLSLCPSEKLRLIYSKLPSPRVFDNPV